MYKITVRSILVEHGIKTPKDVLYGRAKLYVVELRESFLSLNERVFWRRKIILGYPGQMLVLDLNKAFKCFVCPEMALY